MESADQFIDQVRTHNPHQTEFVDAVQEWTHSVFDIAAKDPYARGGLLERIVEPERMISFRVVWEDDGGRVRVNRGYRVQFNSAIGPYKGGLRFHPSVNPSILKMLAFEQIFKNALTGLPMGGGKGGSDFDPKGRSDREVMRFCQAFMTELQRHIGPDTDVPAGDIGVGAREIGYLYGQYRRLANQWDGTLTGKGPSYGGSPLRPEATGYGVVYFTEHLLRDRGEGLDGLRALVSGSGNVAQFCAQKLIERGARVLTMSDSGGTLFDPEGIDTEKLQRIMFVKNVERGRIRELADEFPTATFHARTRPWAIEADWAFPCATQNEVGLDDAETLVRNRVRGITEGANMPITLAASKHLQDAGVVVGPAKAATAGGVAVSGLEMTQNSMREVWSAEQVDDRLQGIMRHIHAACVEDGRGPDGRVSYIRGANVAGFRRVADTMVAYGLV
ncbi:MAG: NADP-specific glutamate dehydrogenase [Myxococcota bacterium]